MATSTGSSSASSGASGKGGRQGAVEGAPGKVGHPVLVGGALILGWWRILIESIERDEGWEEIYVAMQAARDKSGGENLFEVSRIIL